MTSIRLLPATLLIVAPMALAQQAPTAPSNTTDPAPIPTSEVGAAACCHLPAGTAIDLEVLDLLNSAQRKRGDRFGLRVTVPVTVDGQVVIPAGTTGVGEIVHAAPAHGGGAPGELLIAGRFLDVGGRQVPLRGLKLGRTGRDNTALVAGMSVAIGPFALFIRGHEIEIPVSTEVQARIAQDVDLPPATPGTVPTTLSE